MGVVLGNMGGGKTTALINACLNNPGSVFVAYQHIVDMAKKIAVKKGKEINAINYNEFIMNNLHSKYRKVSAVYIDEFEQFMQTLCKSECNFIAGVDFHNAVFVDSLRMDVI